MSFEKKCVKCGNTKIFETDIKQWKCTDCGTQNPPINPILYLITAIVLFWLMCQFVGLPFPLW